MTNRPGSRAVGTIADRRPGRVRVSSISMDWMGEPLTHARAIFEVAWDWLESIDAADWERVHSAARYFHPGYMIDPSTGELDPSGVPGAAGYLAAERGEYKPELLRIVWPSVAKHLPRKNRGRPVPYLHAVLGLSALLICHEAERLDDALQQTPSDREAVARHLYWLQRFATLWQRTAADKPANVKSNESKARRAKAWRDDLLQFHCERKRKNKRLSALSSARAYVNQDPKPREPKDAGTAHKALLEMLRAPEH